MSKDTHHTRTADQPQLQLPESVTIAVAELASAAREGLLALAVGTGLQVLQAEARRLEQLVHIAQSKQVLPGIGTMGGA